MGDRNSGGAARIATFVAVPIALITGVLAFQALRPDPPGRPGPTASGRVSPGATGPVAMPATPLATRPAAVCRALFARLPDTLGTLTRRPVTAGSEQNAAYGDPAVTVACGGRGPSVPPDAQFLRLDGVCWYAVEGPEATAWNLVDREVPVVVNVPNVYKGELLIGLSGAVAPAIARTSDTCA